MYMKNLMVAFWVFGVVTTLNARDLVIENIQTNDDYTELTFNISWKNTWRQGERFHDAVWVFAKYKPDNGSTWNHVYVDSASAPLLEVITVEDKMGIFLRSPVDVTSAAAIPNTSVTLQMDLDSTIAIHPDFKVYGIEMVYVPEGPFYLGDGTLESLPYTDWTLAESYEVISKADYRPFLTQQDVRINNGFPNGYEAFYCMKYPITQEQFADFLNILPKQDQLNILQMEENAIKMILGYIEPAIDLGTLPDRLYPFGDPETRRQGIRVTGMNDVGSFIFSNDFDPSNPPDSENDGQNISANFKLDMGEYQYDAVDRPVFESFLFYLNWAGLRPMTEMEYEKACRGPLYPVKHERAWGNAKYDLLSKDQFGFFGIYDEITNDGYPYEESIAESGKVSNDFSYRVGMEAEPGDDRFEAEASYWGILDLSGNGFPILVSVTKQYLGYHGDGRFNYFSTDDWFGILTVTGTLGYATRLNGRVSETAQSFLDLNTKTFTIDGEPLNGVVQGRGVRQP
jgi:formylglycine-generating enzyme required for sulfatase activity